MTRLLPDLPINAAARDGALYCAPVSTAVLASASSPAEFGAPLFDDPVSDAARQVLTLALHYPIARVSLLEMEDGVFVDPAERALLRAMRGLFNCEIEFGLRDVAEELQRQQEATPSGEEARIFARSLDLLQGRYGTVPPERRPSSRVGELLAQMKRAAPSAMATPQLLHCADIVGAVVDEARQANDARCTGQLRAPITGFKALDEKIGGSLPKIGPSMVLGNTGAGKTAFVTQIAASCGFPALYVTTEMAPAELFRRQMARLTNTFLGRLKSGEIPPAEFEMMARQTAAEMPQLSFVDSTVAFASPSFLRQCAEKVRGDARSVLLVVDSLHTWTRGGSGGLNEYEALNQNLLSLQRLCHQLECPALVVCEQSRAAIAGGGGVNSGAGSRSIEYGAEIVFDLQASKEVDGMGEKSVQLIIAKNRHGATGPIVRLQFNGALQRFKESD